MQKLRLVRIAMLAAIAACSLPAIESHPSAAAPTATDTTATPAPVVQVRGFSHSAVVSVLAWEADDAQIGIRTSITRGGELDGGRRLGDHSLYMTPLYAHDMGGFKYATDTVGTLLLRTGTQRDTYSCFYGNRCSPLTTTAVRIPDSLLRATRDSLVVTFIPPIAEPWTITLRHELIVAYLTKVDSVVADMRKTATK